MGVKSPYILLYVYCLEYNSCKLHRNSTVDYALIKDQHPRETQSGANQAIRTYEFPPTQLKLITHDISRPTVTLWPCAEYRYIFRGRLVKAEMLDRASSGFSLVVSAISEPAIFLKLFFVLPQVNRLEHIPRSLARFREPWSEYKYLFTV